MRLHRIRVEHVRGLPAAEVRFGSGVTVIEAPNESGKTTLFDAFDLLLREKHATNRQEVRDLQPAGRDVGSLVEAELTLGDTHLTVRKQFNRDRRTELEIHTPSRRQLTGDDAHAELRRLLEQHTDVALLDALRFRQGRPLDGVELADSALLASALDASAGGTGQPGDDALYDRVVAERARYFTPTGQPKRLLKDADARVAEVEAEVATLAETVRQLADAAARVDELDAEQVQQEQIIGELHPRAVEHRRRLQRVAQVRAELDGAIAHQHAAQSELERARAALDARQEQVATIGELTGSVQERAGLAGRARELLDGHQSRLDALVQAVQAAEAEEDRVREELGRARAAAELDARRDELWLCRERQRRVRGLVDDAAAAAAFLDEHPVRPELLDRVREAADELRLAEARLDDAAPTVRIRATRALTVATDDGEVPLDSDEVWDRQVPEVLRVVIGDAEIEVDPGNSLADRRGEADAARRRLIGACDELGVAHPAAAEELGRAWDEHRRVVEHRDSALDRELRGTTRAELDDRVRHLATQVAELESQVVVDDGRLCLVTHDTGAAVAALEDEEQAARDTVASARAERDALAAQLQQLRDAATATEVAASHDREQLASATERLARAREACDDDALNGRVGDAEKDLVRTREVVASAEQELAQLRPEEEEQLAANVERQLDGARTRLGEVRDELAGVRATIEVRGGQGVGEALDAARAELERRRDERDSLQARATAAMTLKTAFETARDEAYRTYREPLRERIVQAGRLVFGDEIDVELDERLAVTTRTLRGITLPFARLSAGAREQLAILTALAAADLAGDDGVPLVLDDTLGHSDPQRLERLGAVLGRVRGPQVIVLTCVGARFQSVGGAEVVRLREATTPPRD